MEAYYNDGRERYGTGKSYDWFCKYEDYDGEPKIHTSNDGLWTYSFAEPNTPSNEIEILRYNGCETNIIVPSIIDGKNVASLDSTFDSFYEPESTVIPQGVTNLLAQRLKVLPFHKAQKLSTIHFRVMNPLKSLYPRMCNRHTRSFQ